MISTSKLKLVHYSLSFNKSIAKDIKKNFINQHKNITILTSNRRNARCLKEEFIKLDDAIIIPEIIAITDLDSPELLLNSNLMDKNIVDILEQQLIITRLITKWNSDINYNYAVYLSQQLTSIINELENYEISINEIDNLINDDLSTQWNDNLIFIKFIMENYPTFLENNNLINYTDFRNKITDIQLDLWKKDNNKTIIIAGDLARIPATKKILKTIFNMKNGFIYLPYNNLNFDNDKEYFTQGYFIKNIINNILKTDDIELINIDNDINYNYSAIEEILRDSSQTYKWHLLQNEELKLNNLNIVKCKSMEEEANIISLIVLDKILINHTNTINIISNNSFLNRMVESQLLLHNIIPNNTGGKLFKELEIIQFMDLIIHNIYYNFEPLYFLSLLKYRSNLFNNDIYSKFVLYFEKHFCRGLQNYKNIDDLIKKITDPNYKEIIINIYKNVENIYNIFNNKKINSFKLILENHIKSLENFYNIEIWNSEEGEQIKGYLDKLILYSDYIDDLNIENYIKLFNSLCHQQTYRKQHDINHRVNIITLKESYLQYADTHIIASMNENDLPSNINNNPWINNNIRKKLNINNEDLEYALEAQIFAQLLCNKDVIITHSSKYGNENKLPSVWLKRIYHLYNANKISINDSKYYSLLLKSINSNEYSLEDIVLDPKYQIKDLPDMLSVTSLTRLKDIPYQFYCNNILRLYQMNDINETITPRVIGEITHKMIEYYFNYNEKDENKIFNIISEEYRYNKDNNNKIQNIYRKEIIKKYIYSINNINKDNNEIKPEFQVVYNIKNEFNISINARIDCLIHNNETAEIIDFKTGKFQSISKKNTSIVSNIQLSFGALAVHKIMNLDIKKVSIFGLKEKQYVIDSCNVNHDIYESIENNIIEILKPYYIDNEKIKFNFKTINNPYMKIYIHYSRCYF